MCLLEITSKCQKPRNSQILLDRYLTIEQTSELKMNLTSLTSAASLEEGFFKNTASQNAIYYYPKSWSCHLWQTKVTHFWALLLKNCKLYMQMIQHLSPWTQRKKSEHRTKVSLNTKRILPLHISNVFSGMPEST